MKLSEKITQAMLEGQVRDFSEAYQGAMEEVAIWKRRALEAETLNRKFIAGINSPMHMGEPVQPAQKAVAYLDLGVGGYMDVGTDLTDEELATLPKGRHMLGVIGTYGVDGYVPAQSVPDGVVEALQRLIENGAVLGPASAEDALLVARYRQRILACAPSIPEDFSREELEAVAAGLDTYEKTVNVGNVTGEGDDHLESTTAYAARFIRAMIAIAPEAKS